MFTRIVKMDFKEEEIETFLSNFETIKDKIRVFPGCKHLKLLRDKDNHTIFFTYSRWETVAALEAYRHSELFKGVWANTKPKFKNKAQAWSVDVVALCE